MRSLNTIIASAILATLGYSQCTGGLFAVPLTYAAEASEESVYDESLLLSSVDQNFCLNVTAENERNTDRTAKGGCGDDSNCLEQAKRGALHDGALAETGNHPEILSAALPAISGLVEEFSRNPLYTSIRAGPLYALAHSSAHALVKRE